MKTIEEILNEYTMRRTAAEAIASRAKSELLAACPEIAALEEQKRDALTDSLLLTSTNNRASVIGSSTLAQYDITRFSE